MNNSINFTNELSLDKSALAAVRSSLDQGAVTPAYGPHREAIVKLLNDALATELVCVLRYKRHHFMASGLSSPHIAEEFMVHANEDPTTRRMLEDILAEEEEHADELKDWLDI